MPLVVSAWFVVVSALMQVDGHPQRIEVWLHMRYNTLAECLDQTDLMRPLIKAQPGVSYNVQCWKGDPL